MEGVVLDSLAKVAGCPVVVLAMPVCSATALVAGRIASPGMLPSADLLPHLKCSRPGFGGDGHEADQHGNA